MERIAFIGAVTAAILVGAWYLMGGRQWGIHVSDGLALDPIVAAAPAHTEPQTYADAEIVVSHIAGRVTVTPEDRTDILIEIENPGGVPTPTVEVREGELFIDGHLRGRIEDCLEDGARLRGYGVLAAAALPYIIIRTPRTANIKVGGAAATQVGPAQALEASLSGCGSTQIADVAGALDIDLQGSGEIHAGSSGELNVDLAGSGDIIAGATSALDADLQGSGGMSVGAVTGDADVSVAGSGEVVIAALNGALETDIAGSGSLDVRAGAVTVADIDIGGSGRVNIGAPVARLIVDVMGSGGVDVDAAVGDVDADIAGSGTVNVQSVTGSVVKNVAGSGAVNIGG